MKSLLENWRKYLNEKKIDPEIFQTIEDHVKLPIRSMHLHEDNIILVRLTEEYEPSDMNEINEWWEKSDYFEELQQKGYNVKLVSKNDATSESDILLTKDLL